MADRTAGRRNHLIVFAREPRIGRVKRRLAASIGNVAAGFWYRRQLSDLLRRLSGSGVWRCHLHVTPVTALRSSIWPRPWQVHAQSSGDLGVRMRRALSLPRPGRVVLIGSDIPDIAPRHIRAAFRALGRADIVLGPAADGGYWLVGAHRRRAPPSFAAVRWSTSHALADTVEGLPHGTTVLLLDDTLADVDTATDLAAHRLTQRGQRSRARANEA